jgi:hypothetical protein
MSCIGPGSRPCSSPRFLQAEEALVRCRRRRAVCHRPQSVCRSLAGTRPRGRARPAFAQAADCRSLEGLTSSTWWLGRQSLRSDDRNAIRHGSNGGLNLEPCLVLGARGWWKSPAVTIFQPGGVAGRATTSTWRTSRQSWQQRFCRPHKRRAATTVSLPVTTPMYPPAAAAPARAAQLVVSSSRFMSEASQRR